MELYFDQGNSSKRLFLVNNTRTDQRGVTESDLIMTGMLFVKISLIEEGKTCWRCGYNFPTGSICPMCGAVNKFAVNLPMGKEGFVRELIPDITRHRQTRSGPRAFDTEELCPYVGIFRSKEGAMEANKANKRVTDLSCNDKIPLLEISPQRRNDVLIPRVGRMGQLISMKNRMDLM